MLDLKQYNHELRLWNDVISAIRIATAYHDELLLHETNVLENASQLAYIHVVKTRDKIRKIRKDMEL